MRCSHVSVSLLPPSYIHIACWCVIKHQFSTPASRFKRKANKPLWNPFPLQDSICEMKKRRILCRIMRGRLSDTRSIHQPPPHPSVLSIKRTCVLPRTRQMHRAVASLLQGYILSFRSLIRSFSANWQARSPTMTLHLRQTDACFTSTRM